MTTDAAAARMVEALTAVGIPNMLVGSYSRNYYAIPRSTKDVDIVIELPSQVLLAELASRIAPEFVMDAQITYETITGNVRHIIRCPGSAIVVELFILGNDEFQRHRFARRREVRIPALNATINLPTAEDVVIQKLRWGRPKDLDDVLDVLAVQAGKIDHAYIEDWCRRLNILDRYLAVRATVPEI
ncbi:MAG TPA: hypothetical protein DDZ88_31515 [Verrucomicrobiales bacterium]|nr:hypothetical protein [Verrucomicrobiales bacterium]